MVQNRFIELYIHIPFCERKCKYCDFVSFSDKNDYIDIYVKKLLDEIKAKNFYAINHVVSSIYIGGGTPSCIDEKYINIILETIYNNYPLNNYVEISIEVNPNSSSLQKLTTYYKSGVNRLSIGVQSANDNELSSLGRLHTYKDFLMCYDDAIHTGFSNINFDIMNGIPLQTEESYKNTLKQLVKLNPKHLSIYNLIVEENTPFHEMQKYGTLHLPDETTMEKIDNTTDEICDHFHFQQYEISNFAKKGYECLHNLGYWSDIEYIGFGANASSYIGQYRYKNFADLNKYLFFDYNRFTDDINKYIYYKQATLILKKDHITEYVMLGLRKINGISEIDFYNTFGEDIWKIYGTQLEKYIKMGLLIKDQNRIYFSKYGMKVSNPILADFLL